MTLSPARSVALVTGGSRGIGAAISRRLAADGHAVAINYAGRRDDAEALAAELGAAGAQAIALQADVADPQAVRRLFDAIEVRFGGIDVVVNSAGVLQLAPLADTDDAVFERVIGINLKGAFNVLRESARRVRDGGRIVTLSTSVVGTRLENYSVYAASKSAVETMGAILSKELRGRNITVNAVAPGPTATELFLDGKSPELIERLAKMPPPGAAGYARGHRRCGGLPGRCRWRMDQWPGTARQRWDGVGRADGIHAWRGSHLRVARGFGSAEPTLGCSSREGQTQPSVGSALQLGQALRSSRRRCTQ